MLKGILQLAGLGLAGYWGYEAYKSHQEAQALRSASGSPPSPDASLALKSQDRSTWENGAKAAVVGGLVLWSR